MITCPFKQRTTVPEHTCALRYRNATRYAHATPGVKANAAKQPGWDDPLCSGCHIGRDLYKAGRANRPEQPPEERVAGLKTVPPGSPEAPSDHDHVLDGMRLFERQGRLAKSKPVLVDADGEIKGKVCSMCELPKLLDQFYTQPQCQGGKESMCKNCHTERYDKPRRKQKRAKGKPARGAEPISALMAAAFAEPVVSELSARGFALPRQIKISIVIDLVP